MRLLIPVLILSVLVSACGGEGEPQSTATQVATQAPTTAPTGIPAGESTEPPVQPTEQPGASMGTPESTSTLPSPATPAPAFEGRVSFHNDLAVADQLVVTMKGVPSPPDGFVYEGWLIDNHGVIAVSTGIFQVDTGGNVDYAWTSCTGENLIANYSGFAVTVELADDDDPDPSTSLVFRGAPASEMLTAARRVFSVNEGEPSTPRNISYGQGLLNESQVTDDHILNAYNAAAIGAFAGMRVHAEHVINIIEGTEGPRFADHNADGRAENPGDGFGTLRYARQIAILLPDARADLSPVESLLLAIQDKTEEVAVSKDVASAQPLLDELKAMGERLILEAAPELYSAALAAVSYPITPTPFIITLGDAQPISSPRHKRPDAVAEPDSAGCGWCHLVPRPHGSTGRVL
jgi:hypothetical protein